MILKGEATVVKNAGSHYLLSELPEWKLFPAVLRGKVRLDRSSSTNPVAVGDRVLYSIDCGNEENGLDYVTEQNPAVITSILPRSNYLIRRSTNLSRQSHVIAANLDQAVIAASIYFPEIKLPFLDRILVTCEVYRIPVVIALNKVDLYEGADAMEDFCRIYRNAGYKVVKTSVRTGEGIEELRTLCKGRLNLFAGESGVGKSSLIKALDGNLDPKIGRISMAHLQGKHTTSLYEMYPLAFGGYVIDSPGLRGFGLVDLEKEEISKYFPEMLRIMDNCRFCPCTHTHEPGCAVKQAVDSSEISAERYNSYLGMLEEDSKFR